MNGAPIADLVFLTFTRLYDRFTLLRSADDMVNWSNIGIAGEWHLNLQETPSLCFL